MAKLITLSSKDVISLTFGEWFDRTYGNTYYDVEVRINDKHFTVQYGYGYNAGDKQSIDEALEYCGYRLRKNKRDPYAPYRAIKVSKVKKIKKALYKTTEQVV